MERVISFLGLCLIVSCFACRIDQRHSNVMPRSNITGEDILKRVNLGCVVKQHSHEMRSEMTKVDVTVRVHC